MKVSTVTSKFRAEGVADSRANDQDDAIRLQSSSKELDQLHEWQSSPAGMIASYVRDLVSSSTELTRLSGDAVLFGLIATEVSDLELARSEISKLIFRIRRTQGAAA